MQVKQAREAETQFERALRLHDGFPSGSLAWRLQQADLLNGLGSILLDRRLFREAELPMRQQIALRERLREEFPAVRTNVVDLAGAWCNLGLALREQNQLEDARSWYDQAVKLLDELRARGEPLPVHASLYLLVSVRGRAQLLQRQRHWADAARDWERTASLVPPHDIGELNVARTFQALCLGMDGQHYQAVALVEAMQQRTSEAPHLATLAQACCAAGRHAPLAVRERYHTLAVRLLRRTAEGGWLRQNLPGVKADQIFEPLRQRDDFNSLLQEVGGAVAGGRPS
jgi:tetratricopeptide (TPR) repeat protein